MNKNYNHLTHRSHHDEPNKATLQKNITLNVIKKFCMRARNRPETFWQT